MSIHDYNIANQTFPATRSDINDVLGAIVTNNSNATAPTTTFAYMFWFDTANNILKQRNGANNAWINIGTYDQTNGLFFPAFTPLTSAKTGAYTVVLADRNSVILADATSAAFTVTLPAAATAGAGFIVTVKKTDASANAVTIDANASETIDGATTFALTSRYDTAQIVCDGTAWFLLGKTYGVFTSSAPGLAPASGGGIINFLRADGSWQPAGAQYISFNATTSGTSLDLTGIPSDVTVIHLIFYLVSTNGTSGLIVQLGDSGGFETTGYNSCNETTTYTSGFNITPTTIAATNTRNGRVTLSAVGGTFWACDSTLSDSTNATTSNFAGSKGLSDVLTQIRLTTQGGANTLDGGSVTVIYG